MASACGALTFIFVVTLSFLVVSLAFAHDRGDALANDDVILLRRMRRAGGARHNSVFSLRGQRFGGGNRGNRRSNEGGRRQGRRRGGGGGGGRGGGGGGGRGRSRQQQSPFNRREQNLVGRLTEASGQFSLQLYGQLKQSHPELVFSPFSIHTALTMTYMGARGRTARQMLQVLGLRRLRSNKAHLAYAALMNSLTNTGNVTLHVANAVYVKPNVPVEDAFRTGLQTMYKAAFDHFDLQAEGGAEAPINRWVAEKTVNKVENLLSPGTIDDMTAMIIINAIYFKGAWLDPFDPVSTYDGPFHRGNQPVVTVPLMTRTGQYNYTEASDLNSHIVEMPYQDGRFSMFIILPMRQDGVGELEDRLTAASLNAHLQNLNRRHVELHLPKFKTRSTFVLKETLQSMGMRVPFSNRASFEGICSTLDLKITQVVHEAVIEVTEQGTEAAGATAVLIGLRSFPIQTTVVKADHPFLYAIRDNLSNAWLFMGKYAAQE